MKSNAQKKTLPQLLRSSGETMARELNSRLVPHNGENGRGREQIIRSFLTDHLPSRYLVSTGFVFDCHGRISKQIDIVIADASICPIFKTSGGIQLFPCEAVIAVGEVKSKITSNRELDDALDALIEVKAFDRSSNGSACDPRYNETLNPVDNYLHQIFSFVFVTGRAIKAETAGDYLLEKVHGTPIHQMPNVIFSLNKYIISYCCDAGVCPNVMHARGVSIRKHDAITDTLQQFYVMLGRALDASRVASLSFWEYLSQSQGTDALILCDSYESPPRFLSEFAPLSRLANVDR